MCCSIMNYTGPQYCILGTSWIYRPRLSSLIFGVALRIILAQTSSSWCWPAPKPPKNSVSSRPHAKQLTLIHAAFGDCLRCQNLLPPPDLTDRACILSWVRATILPHRSRHGRSEQCYHGTITREFYLRTLLPCVQVSCCSTVSRSA